MSSAATRGGGPERPSHPQADPLSASGRRPEPDPLVGRTVSGKYTILELIARGGMGKVYKAEQQPLARICALKILNPKYEGDEDPEFQRRFYLEASTAAKLSHPSTVTIFDYGRDGDIYYIAMEYVRGRTLFRVLRDEGPLPEQRVAHVLRQVARSLREAHGIGVIHRDMKPANIVLLEETDEPDTVKVLDFGLVKQVAGDDSEDLTQQGLFMGSPKYMAPEQILGNPVSPRTDVYSLGVVAYELLTGSVPFDRGTSVKTLMAHVNDPPPAMRDVNPHGFISADMEHIVMRCLRKEPTDRYASMDELLRELKGLAGGGALTDSMQSFPRVQVPTASGTHPLVSRGEGDLFSERMTRSGQIPQAPPSRDRQSSTPPLSAPSLSGPPSFSGPTSIGTSPRSLQADLQPSATPEPMHHSSLPDEPRAARRRSGWLLAAVLVACAAGGGVIWRNLQQKPVTVETAGAAEPAPEAAADTTGEPPPTTAPKGSDRVVRVTSDPAGARVSEGTSVVCAETPCDVRWTGDDATRRHRLSFEKKGYETAELDVTADDDKLSVKLPKPVVIAAPAPDKHGAPPPPATKSKTLSGYKESPY
jgi:eukaryotic-like serine/threonine-protein kinase